MKRLNINGCVFHQHKENYIALYASYYQISMVCSQIVSITWKKGH